MNTLTMEKRVKFQDRTGTEIKMIDLRVGDRIGMVDGHATFHSKGRDLMASVLETCSPSYSMVVTKTDGSKPYAVRTVDSDKDYLGKYKLAQVQVQTGYCLTFMLNDTEGRKAKTVIAMKVDVIEEDELTVTVIYKESSTSNRLPKVIRNAIIHLSAVVDKFEYPAPLIDKYSYNTKRVIRYALLRYTEEEGLVGEREIRGRMRKILFNKNSLKEEKLVEGKIYLCRIFYSIRFEGGEVIVNGYIIRDPDVYKVNPIEATKHSRVPEEAIGRIKRAKLTTGQIITVQYNSIGVLRMLYNIDGSIRSFNLSSFECGLIESISDVS